MISAGYLFDWFDQFWLEQSPKNVMEFPQEIEECAASMEDSPVKCLPYSWLSWGYSSSVVASGRKLNEHFRTALYNLLDEVSPPPNPFSHTHALSEGNLVPLAIACIMMLHTVVSMHEQEYWQKWIWQWNIGHVMYREWWLRHLQAADGV